MGEGELEEQEQARGMGRTRASPTFHRMIVFLSETKNGFVYIYIIM